MGTRRGPPGAAGNSFGCAAGNARETLRSGVSLRRLRRLAVEATLVLLAACGGDRLPIPEAPPWADPGFVVAGGWRMDYALTMTRDLPSAIAGSYGIEQRPNLAVLTVTLAPTDARAERPAAEPAVAATAVTLTGERTTLVLARRDEAGRPTWLASVEVRQRVPVTIEIRARATTEGPELRARLTREFRFD